MVSRLTTVFELSETPTTLATDDCASFLSCRSPRHTKYVKRTCKISMCVLQGKEQPGLDLPTLSLIIALWSRGGILPHNRWRHRSGAPSDGRLRAAREDNDTPHSPQRRLTARGRGGGITPRWPHNHSTAKQQQNKPRPVVSTRLRFGQSSHRTAR